MNPYSVLGVPREADDACIRQAYLDAVKRHGPETDPGQFKIVSAAYQAIGREDDRIRMELFGTDATANSPLPVFLAEALAGARLNPMPLDTFKRHLAVCSKP